MYRFRFENADQIFDGIEGEVIILPLFECEKHPELLEKYHVYAEIPAIIWEGKIGSARAKLENLREIGLKDAVCENVGGIELCKELGLDMHGGMFLNILNTSAIECYAAMGLKDVTVSFEVPFGKMKQLRGPIPRGMVSYGYLPLMKFRACPAMGKDGCKNCKKENYLTDRKGERFRILCRNSEYSELLNCVPLYVADKNLPLMYFETLYFTVETKDECKRIFEMIQNKDVPEFRRTAGLYNRELL